MTIDLKLEIPDSEVQQDIADTKFEIRSLRRRIDEALEGIVEREEFIAKLYALLEARRLAAQEETP